MRKASDFTPLPNERLTHVYEMNELRQHLGRQKSLSPRLLEVGCGLRSSIGARLHDDNYRFHLHGLDLSPAGCRVFADQQYADEAVVGDASQMPFKEHVYDVLVSHYVLEHVKDCRKALKEMSRVVAKDGLLVLVFPNPTSPDSLMTRLTPFRFHVFFRKVIQRRPQAGKRTFPTFFSFGTVDNVVRCLEEDGFSDVKAVFFPETHYRFKAWRLMGRLVNLYDKILAKLALNGVMSSVIVIARK